MPPVPPRQAVEIPSGKPTSIGPLAGTVIIVALLLIGALYFRGAWLNKHEPAPLPYIPDQTVTR